jgi:3-deoxy-alpha-D-manno-octulosonate 8-oxidase
MAAGSFNQLDEIIEPHRRDDDPMIFLVDHFFGKKPLINRIPLRGHDKIVFADVTHEPKTSLVDKLAQQLKDEFRKVSGIIGIGGGSTMDPCKSCFFNDEQSRLVSGLPGLGSCKVSRAFIKWEFQRLVVQVQKVSRTCVLTGPTKKAGNEF